MQVSRNIVLLEKSMWDLVSKKKKLEKYYLARDMTAPELRQSMPWNARRQAYIITFFISMKSTSNLSIDMMTNSYINALLFILM